MFHTHLVHISDKILHDGRTERVVLPGVMGEFEVLDGHIAVVSLLSKGCLSVFDKGGQKRFAIEQGLMRFDGKELYAVVE